MNNTSVDSLIDSFQDEPETPAAVMNPAPASKLSVSDLIDTFEDEVPQVEQAYRDSIDADPDRVAKVYSLAKKVNEPPAFVDKNLDRVEKVANAPAGSFWTELEQEQPEVAEWLSNRSRMAMAQDDVGVLSKTAKIFKEVGSAWEVGNLNIQQSQLGWQQLIQTMDSGEASTYGESDLQAIEKRSAELGAKNEDLPWYHPASAAEQIPNLLEVGKQAATRGTQGALAGGAAALAGGVTAVTVPAAAGTGLALGMTMGSAEATLMLEAGSAYREFLKIKDKNGNPVDPKLAAGVALGVGGVNAGLEFASLRALMRVFPGGDRLLSAFQQNEKIFKNVTKGSAIRMAAKRYLESILVEGATEAVQETTNIVGGESIKALSEGEFESPTLGEAASRVADAGAKGAAAAVYLGAPGLGLRVTSDFKAAKKAEDDKKAFEELAKTASESKLRERSPEVHGEFVAEVAKGTALEHGYIAPEALQVYFQGKGVQPEAAYEELGIADQVKAAEETGGKIQLPMSTILKVVGTEYGSLSDHITFSPDGLSVAEVKERGEQAKTSLDAEFKKAEEGMAKDAEKQATYDRIYQAIRDDARAAIPREMSPREQKKWDSKIDKDARLWAARAFIAAKQHSEVTGREISPEEWFNQNRPTVINEKGQGKPGSPLPVPPPKYDSAILGQIRDEIAAGEMQEGGLKTDPDGTVTGRFGRSSTFPDYFKNKGYSKKSALSAIEKKIAGEKLTEKQEALLKDIYFNSGKVEEEVHAEPFLQTQTPAPVFYSKLIQTVEEKMGKTATAEQINGMLREIKPEERTWMGLDEFLKGKEKVSKDDLIAFLRGNMVEIQEIQKGAGADSPASADQIEVLASELDAFSESYADLRKEATDALENRNLGRAVVVNLSNGISHGYEDAAERVKRAKEFVPDFDWDALYEAGQEYARLESELSRLRQKAQGTDTKFSQYTLPGGENYREILFTLPNSREALNKEFDDLTSKGVKMDDPRIVAVLEAMKAVDGGSYKSSHWAEKNVLAHTRLNDRVDADGKRVLFVEEIQSDWHQEGRKKGYRGEGPLVTREQEQEAGRAAMVVIERNERLGFDSVSQALGAVRDHADWASRWDIRDAKDIETVNRWREINAQYRSDPGRVPDAPFRKTWHEFVLKRIIRMAAEQGYDRIAWTTGEQQADRYSLNKHLKEVQYSAERETLKTFDHNGGFQSFIVPQDKLGDYVGQETSQKLLASKEDETGYKSLSGLDLKVGGEGMKGFYDKILVDFANKFGKKYGAKVAKSEVEAQKGALEQVLNYEGPELTPDELRAIAKKKDVRVAKQLDDVAYFVNMEMPFAEAMEQYGSPAAAEAIGGELVPYGGKDTVKVHSLEITPALKYAALNEGFSLFQNEESPQGSVAFTNSGPILKLFKIANESTFLHESAHIWLEDLFKLVIAKPEALPEKVAADWTALSEWLGVSADQKKLTVEQHEKFARGFEAYVREGEAPSLSLRKVFNSFRRWLTEIYRDVRGLNVEVSPEVRGVMDRMLATEEEILEARGQAAQSIETQIDGLSPEVKARLESLREQAHEEAVSILLKRQMDELKAESKDFIARKRQEIEEKLRAAIAEEQVYKSEAELKARLDSKKTGKYLAGQFLASKMTEAQQGHFEFQADLSGYSSADEMAKAIQAAPTFEAALAARVRSEMAAFADLKDTAAMKDEAMKAIHNDHELELMALESQILIEKADEAGINEIAKKRRQAEIKVEAQAVKARARELIRSMDLRRAVKVGPFITAERQAAERAARAIAKKDYDLAAAFKRQQMMNHALVQESLKVKRDSDKWISYLDGLRTKDIELFKKEEHFHQAADLLSRLGFARTDYDPSLRKESLSGWRERLSVETNIINIADWVTNENEVKDYRELTVERLYDAVNALKNIVKVANFEGRAFKIAKGASFDEIKSKLRFAMKLGRMGRTSQAPSMEPDQLDRVKSLAAKYNMSLTKTQNILKNIQGWRDDGAWMDTFWKPVYEAANEESDLLAKSNQGLKEAFSIYTPKERREMVTKRVFYDELGTSVTKIRLIMMALNLGNADNKQKLFDNRPVGVEQAREWNEQVVMGLLQRNLTEKDWQFVQSIWYSVNALWPETAALHKRVTGFTPGKVEAVPLNVITKDGKAILLKGGYFPLREDRRNSVLASDREDAAAPLYTEKNPAWIAATKTGHTKQRTGAQYPLSLEHTLIYQHMRDVIHDITFRETVLDLRRLVMDTEVQTMLKESVGLEGAAEVKEWVAAIATGNTSQPLGPLDKIVSVLRQRTVIAALTLRVSTIVQNFANFAVYGGAVDGFTMKDSIRAMFTRALPHWLAAARDREKFKAAKEYVFERSPFMRDKHQNPDFSFYESHAKAFGEDSKIREFGAGLMAGSDELTSIPMWMEAFKMKTDAGLDEADAVAYADSLVSSALGSGRKYDASGIQRGSELAKALSMFYTFFNTEYNRWQREVGLAQVDEKNRARFLGFVASRLLVFNTLSLLISGKGPDDDEDALSWWFKETLKYPLALVPGVRDVASVALDQTFGFKGFGYRASPATGAIEAGLGSFKAGVQLARGDAEMQQLLEAIGKSASYIAPYPDQFNAWFWNAYDSAFNGMEPKAADLYRRRRVNER